MSLYAYGLDIKLAFKCMWTRHFVQIYIYIYIYIFELVNMYATFYNLY